MPPRSGSLPSVSVLGVDLVRTPRLRQVGTLALPFVLTTLYFVAALGRCWWLAVPLAVIASYATYGSVSHDLVHRSLGLPARINDVFLSVIEALVLRSGTAYRVSHLQHHRRLGFRDDAEGEPARQHWSRALLESPAYIPRLWLWAWRNANRGKRWLMLGEAAWATGIAVVAFALLPKTPALLVYVAAVTASGWGFPIAFVVVQHEPCADDELRRTRAFRGRLVPALLLQHLFHLEHHLYPMVPAHRWRELARRLDPHLARAGVRPIPIP